MQDSKISRNFVLKIIMIVFACLIVRYFHYIIGTVLIINEILSPFIISLAVVYIWNLIITPIEKLIKIYLKNKLINKYVRVISIILSLLLLFFMIVVIFKLVIPQLFLSLSVLTVEIPKFIGNVKDFFLELTEGVDWASEYRKSVVDLQIDWQKILKNIITFFGKGVSGVLATTVNALSTIGTVISVGFQVFVFSVYVITSKEKLKIQFDKILKAYICKNKREKIYYFLNLANQSFSNFVKGQVTDATIIGVMLYVALILFKMPYALSISVVVAIMALIPILGAFIGGCAGFIMIAAADLNQALVFLAIFMTVQQLEGNLIYPKVVGESVGLPGIWVFFAVMTGGAIGGALGMLVSVPLFATFYKILKNNVNNKLQSID